uniref:Peptidase S9 prolyl oligopeptidase catalytic domain-containing protein n=1 Tax=viral metagenome TaxID=1070528 RepID=A0A6C0JJS0_9ZZZZ
MNNYTHSLYKKRNITKKTYKYFVENLNKYLTPEEMSKVPVNNVLHKYYNKYPKPNNHEHLHLNEQYNKNKSQTKIKMFIQKIRKYLLDTDKIYSIDENIWKTKLKKDNYYNYYIKHKCKKYDILNVDLLSKKIPFFSLSEFEINPNGTKILFGVDFVGSRMYHLFLKDLYNNEIKEIHLPSQPIASMKDMYNDTSVARVSDIFLWINDDEICYISQNKYYNQDAIYIYNINTKHKYLLKKIPPGNFGNIYISSDSYYIIISISDYNTEELYIIDNDDGKLICGKPIITKKDSVSYPYIDHIDGEWILYERNKTHDLLKRTTDFKTYKIDYSNTNIYEIINRVVFIENTYMFTLIYQNGMKLFSLKCNKIIEHFNEKIGYIEMNVDISYLKDFTFTIHYYLSKFNTYHIGDSIILNKKYYEKKVYITPHLFFTVLSKEKPHLSKCVLFGYGSYSTYEECEYSPHYIALIESGFTVIIAHLRGGGEYGYKGYSDGRLLHKKHTFIDFIKIADYIVEHKFTTREKLAIWGRSAGGLLISTVINMRPDLCNLAILGVPFVDINYTLNNTKLPLGMETSSEYGDITNTKVKKYVESYAPLNHINTSTVYPNIFIYTNVYDTLVPFNGPILYYNKMKEVDVFKNKDKEISIFIDSQFGHTQGSSTQKKIESYAMIFDQITRYIL